jgi:predicted dehydrogenase/threonine dehydrogenase-like Zn-dependent dehydrogenase
MKQVLIKNGAAIVDEIPAPLVEPKTVLVKVEYSCVSVGTEMAGIRMSSLPLYKRALKQPENVKKVLEMVKSQGLKSTIDRVSGKLAAGSPTGYSVSGVVIAVGNDVAEFKVGDRVACAGAGIANHAEYVNVPVNLVVRIPDLLGFEDASTVTLGAIAMQGVRRMNATLGETIVVIGLGVLGQITAQLLKANGCKVIGIDLDNERIRIAMAHGLDKGCSSNEELMRIVDIMTGGVGADGVLITASSDSDSIVSASMQISRKKGRVVLVGDVGLNLKRSDFYVKELDFFISTSYGPGRYDPYYENEGQDYPIGYVRWTENRNMAEYLYLLSVSRVNINDFYAQSIYDIESASLAFEALKTGTDKPLMVLLRYPERENSRTHKVLLTDAYLKKKKGKVNVAVIGAGSFALGMHLPNMQRLDSNFNIHAVMSRTGSNAKAIAHQYSAQYATTDINNILNDDEVDMVLITTRHNLHAEIVLQAIKKGKFVFVEKPLAVNFEELSEIEHYVTQRKTNLIVTGFNRRFAPILAGIKQKLNERNGPVIINYIMNAGYIPKDHWVQTYEGSGRNIGEACHIYDLFNHLTGSVHTNIQATSMNAGGGKFLNNDNFNATIEYADGSVCNLIYSAAGHKSFPKEEMTIFCEGEIIRMTDYKSVEIFGNSIKTDKRSTVDKGQFDLMKLTGEFITGRTSEAPISFDEQYRATVISFEVEKLIKKDI